MSKQIVEKSLAEIKRTLTQASFMSKLNQLVKRLNIPISECEIIMISNARKLRNNMIHGIGMDGIELLEAKKLCGVISRIISYKYKNLVEGVMK